MNLSIKKKITSKINEIINSYLSKGSSLKDLKKYFLKTIAINDLINDINKESIHLFKDVDEYKEYIKKLINEIMSDRISNMKDNKSTKKFEQFNNDIAKCKNCDFEFDYTKTPESGMVYVKCPNCDKPVTQKDIKNENISLIKFENFKSINEIHLPVFKIDEICNNIDKANVIHKRLLAVYYKCNEKFIDIINKDTHHFKVNDMSGNIMGNNRVVFDAFVYSDTEIKQISDNLVEYSVNEFMKLLPNELNIFGIELKPESFIDKEKIKEIFVAMFIEKEVIRVITEILNLDYKGKTTIFHIWSAN
jgi:hypothetical protein